MTTAPLLNLRAGRHILEDKKRRKKCCIVCGKTLYSSISRARGVCASCDVEKKKTWTKWQKRRASIVHKWEIVMRGTTFDEDVC